MTHPPLPEPGTQTWRTERLLADGRRILYFDDEPGRLHSDADLRQIEPVDARSTLRHDPIDDEWVIIAAHRQVRTHLPPSDECPLCPSTVARSTEIPARHYDVAVFENRFPSLTPHLFETAATEGRQAPTTGGRCEVVSFTDDHDASFATLSERRLATVGRAMVDRTVGLGAEPGVEYVLCFENRGQEIGVTLHHPHGQVYAYPFVPARITRSLDSARRHRAAHGSCLFCDVVRREITDAVRVVARSDHFVTFVPHAARWPFEIHTYPVEHVSDLSDLEPLQLTELMVLQADTVSALDRLFDRPMPYTAGWLQAPVRADADLNHLRVTTVSVRRTAEKLKYFAGSETLVGAFINDVVPEEAAELLRGVWQRGGGDV